MSMKGRAHDGRHTRYVRRDKGGKVKVSGSRHAPAWLHRLVAQAVRPYIMAEMPGWGRVYSAIVGDYRHNDRWRGAGVRHMRGKGHGYELCLDLASWSNRSTYFTGRYPDDLNMILNRVILRPGDVYVDIGGNEGMVSLDAARIVGEGGRVIAFEPNPGPRAVFRTAIERNAITQIDLRPYGLGAAPAVLPLSVPAINTGEGTFGSAHDKAEVTVVACEVRVGDDELRDVTPALIKIDVEGFEAHVVRGLRGLLARSRAPIVMEISDGYLAAAGSRTADLLGEMGALGYVAMQADISGRGKGLRATARRLPPDATFDVTTDVLFVHGSDPLLPTINERLANQPPY